MGASHLKVLERFGSRRERVAWLGAEGRDTGTACQKNNNNNNKFNKIIIKKIIKKIKIKIKTIIILQNLHNLEAFFRRLFASEEVRVLMVCECVMHAVRSD